MRPLGFVLAAALLGFAPGLGAEPGPEDWVIESPRGNSIEELRREAYQYSEQDPVTLLKAPPAAAPQPAGTPPLYVNEPDPYFVAIIRQILTEAEGGDPSGSPSRFARKLKDAFRLRGRM